MRQLLIATSNVGKAQEFAELLADLDVDLVTPAGLQLFLEVEEHGQTFAENACFKAAAFAHASNLISLGDDSGLEVEALAGAPGLYSARYAGPGASDAERRAKLVREVRHWPAPRTALFRCALAVAQPDGTTEVFEGTCRGEIALEERGTNGFGYDPIFYLPAYGRTMAELPPEVKNQISHRARAVQAARSYLRALLQNE
jgi:XTP/dITP diphosphohydrolase